MKLFFFSRECIFHSMLFLQKFTEHLDNISFVAFSLCSVLGNGQDSSFNPFFVISQYAEKLFVRRPRDCDFPQSVAQQMWDAVCGNDKKAVYRLIVNGEGDVNSVYDQSSSSSSLTLSRVILIPERTKREDVLLRLRNELLDRTSSGSSSNIPPEETRGCSLLHCACEKADIGMVELLLQYGANVNATDSSGQTPLHYCIIRGKATLARLLLTR